MPPTTKWSHSTKTLKWQGAPSPSQGPWSWRHGEWGGRGPALSSFQGREGRGFTCLSKQQPDGTSDLTKGGQLGRPWPFQVSQTPGWDPRAAARQRLSVSQGGKAGPVIVWTRGHTQAGSGRRAELSRVPEAPPCPARPSPAKLRATSRNPSVAVSHGHRGSPWRRGWGPWC